MMDDSLTSDISVTRVGAVDRMGAEDLEVPGVEPGMVGKDTIGAEAF